MSTDEFQDLWKAYDAKLERSLQLNKRLFEQVQQEKTRSVLRSLIVSRVLGIVIGSPYLALLGFALYYVRTQPIMAVSIGVIFVCTALAIGAYIRDLTVLHSISYSDSVVEAQKKLAEMRSSIIRVLRVCWIQLPFWATFFVSNKLLRVGGRQFLLIEIPIVLFLTVLAIILYRNITVENAQKKKWVAALISGSGARSVARAIGLLKEVEEFKKEG